MSLIDPATLSLAVVVHQLIPADSAGILFAANPVDGERDRIVINATWGLGEAIVGGQVTPDTVIVDKSNLHILLRETATKTIMTVRTDNGTEDQPVRQAQQNQPVIDDATAIELARCGAQIEAHYGLPMDIEWAIADARIAILQARPITNLPPAPLRDVPWEPPRPGTIWMRRQVVEHMPEPLSPLFGELYLRDGLYHSMETLAVFASDLSGFEITTVVVVLAVWWKKRRKRPGTWILKMFQKRSPVSASGQATAGRAGSHLVERLGGSLSPQPYERADN